MAGISFKHWLSAGMASVVLTVLSVPSAFALSNGCTAVNNLSGATSLSYASNRYLASQFLPGDALTLTFNDSGSALGGSVMSADSVSVARYNLSNAQTYNSANTTSNTPHAVTISVPAGSLEANGVAIRATTTFGQISNLIFRCTNSSQVSSDATLSGLSLSAGSLSPGFASGTTSYTASVSNATSSVNVRPTATDNTSTITVNGTPVTSGSDSGPVNLVVGSNILSVSITAADGLTTKSYSINVTRDQGAPVVSNVTATVAANSSNNPITLIIAGNATAVAVASGASGGSAVASGTTISYTPTAGYSGSDSFTYNASNGSGTSSPATVTVTVSPPTLIVTPSSGTLTAGQVGVNYSRTLSSSAGTSPYAWSASGLPAGISLHPSTGVLSGIPTTAGNFNLSVLATDANGATGSASYTLSIAAAPPVTGPVSASVAANTSGNAITLNLSGGAADSVAIATAASHGTASASGLSITYTPSPGFSGTDSFTYTASNATGTSAPATITITVSSSPLTFSPASGALPRGEVGTAYNTQINATGGVAPYHYSATGLPSGLSLNTSGAINGVATVAGNFNVSVTATDNAGVRTSGTVNYTLEIAEQLPIVAPVTVTVGANTSSNPVALALFGGTAVSVSIVSAASHGTATASGTSIRYTPTPGFSGSDSFTYTATNTAGTSSVATVNVTVIASALALSPAAGSLPAALVGTAYTQAFSATGGANPYHFSAAGIPAGLTINPVSGTLTGIPATSGSISLSVTVTDANGVQVSATYSLTIAATPNAPNAADTAVATRAGQDVTVDLSAGATGGPFISATLVQVPAQYLGTARLNGLRLSFTPTARASGLLTLRYTLTNQQGTSQPATLTIQISARPDPGQDQEVVGTVNAQTQSAAQFAKAQISNFNDRLEQLHGRDGHSNAFNLRFGLTQAEALHEADDDLDIFRSLAAFQAAPDEQWTLQRASQAKASDQPPAGDISLWTGGYVDFGKTQRSGTKVSNTLIGISGGIDYRLSRSMTVGAGIGIGRDKNDIGSSGSSSRGESYSAAIYGSYHPGPVFLDALLGYSWLTFDSDRYVSDVSRYASGSRRGDQLFGSLSSGYEARGENWLVSPYGRLDASTTWLHGFTESDAADYNLDYADQRISLLSGIAGLRGQYGIPLGWSYVNLRSRVEYSHTLNAGSTAKMGYADLADDAYSIRTEGYSQNTILGSLGLDFLWASGLSTGVTYQGTRALGDPSRSDSLALRVAYRF